MTDKEKLEAIRAETERRIQECKDMKIDSSYYDGLVFAFEELLDFINSLPEEPVSEELEKVVEEIVDPTVLNAYGVKEIANRLRRTMIEPVSEDNNLRKASEEYLKVLSETPYNNTPITNVQTIVRELITFLDNPSKYNPNHIEEPVSGFLEEAAKQYSSQDKFFIKLGDVLAADSLSLCAEDSFMTGAQWQIRQMRRGAFIPGAKSIVFKLGENFTIKSNEYDVKKAMAYNVKEGDKIICYFMKLEN